MVPFLPGQIAVFAARHRSEQRDNSGTAAHDYCPRTGEKTGGDGRRRLLCFVSDLFQSSEISVFIFSIEDMCCHEVDTRKRANLRPRNSDVPAVVRCVGFQFGIDHHPLLWCSDGAVSSMHLIGASLAWGGVSPKLKRERLRTPIRN
jgi:hypothetical protein